MFFLILCCFIELLVCIYYIFVGLLHIFADDINFLALLVHHLCSLNINLVYSIYPLLYALQLLWSLFGQPMLSLKIKLLFQSNWAIFLLLEHSLLRMNRTRIMLWSLICSSISDNWPPKLHHRFFIQAINYNLISFRLFLKLFPNFFQFVFLLRLSKFALESIQSLFDHRNLFFQYPSSVMNFLAHGVIKLLCAHSLELIVFCPKDLDFYYYFLCGICEVGGFCNEGLIHVKEWSDTEPSYIINLSAFD